MPDGNSKTTSLPWESLDIDCASTALERYAGEYGTQTASLGSNLKTHASKASFGFPILNILAEKFFNSED